MLKLQSDDKNHRLVQDMHEQPQFKLPYISSVEFLALDFDLQAGLSIEDVIVARVDIQTPSLRKLISLNVVDYLLIRTAYGVNLNFMDGLDPEFKTLPEDIRDDLARSLIAAMETRELDHFFRGNALEEFFRLLGLSHSAFCQMTNISLNQVLNALKGSGEISQYAYLNMLSMYRLLNTTLSLPSAPQLLDERTFSSWAPMANLFERVKVPKDIKDNGETYEIEHLVEDKEYHFQVSKADLGARDINEILELLKPAKKIKKHIRAYIAQLKKLNEVYLPENCAEVNQGYVISLDDKAYVVNADDLKFYRLGLVKRLLNNKEVLGKHREEVMSALAQLVIYHYKKLFQKKVEPAFTVGDITADKPNELAYDSEIPILCSGGITLTYEGQEIFLTSADLFDIHAGLAFPMVVVNAGATVCEDLYKELDFIAHQYFINEELYNSTWVDINKEFRISKADLVSYKIHDLNGRFSIERADKFAPSWQFLMLPIVANEVAGEA
ncbi:hypothetical protein ACNO5E_18465 [Vibrio parahaemolyticus]|uniref:hypothetical protein n=1 Tax=Vibrio parahaemolyticus TaxID=670 RepID=UPI0008137C1D|nr:hypothetical protein [Vibrio parahaemolyticus]OCP68433.1 hypothetical protein AKH08_16620 [Vibrio parahaemolyticus]